MSTRTIASEWAKHRRLVISPSCGDVEHIRRFYFDGALAALAVIGDAVADGQVPAAIQALHQEMIEYRDSLKRGKKS